MMFSCSVLCLCILFVLRVSGQRDCTDLRGRLVSHGIHYVPGPDTCTLCVCDNGVPLECKAVLCSPPQDCRSFRVGVTCCEFICLDDVVKPADAAEANVRVAAGGAAAVVLATVLLVVYRVRKQKRRRATHADDQRSLTSIGCDFTSYISGSMGYMSGTCETALGAWKPPGHYLPRGEAPPPYDEVVAQCRAENARLMAEAPYHRSYPATVESMARPDELSCNGHGYVNISRPVQQIPNPQNCYNAPLLQTVHPAEVREVNQMPHYPLAPNMSGLPRAVRLTGSLGAISGRLSVPREPDHERPHNVPGFYTNAHLHSALHRTIPRISTAIEALELGAFRRAEMGAAAAGAGEVRRSFHRPAAARRDTGRSVPRHLDLASADTHLESSLRLSSSGGRSRAQSTDNVGGSPPPVPPVVPVPHGAPISHGAPMSHGAPVAPVPLVAPVATASKPDLIAATPHPPSQSTLPLTVDKPSCECSYAAGGGGGAAGDEHDDYRNECENCKSANSSRWVLEGSWSETAEEGGTQTLQRRAPPPAPPAPATATLPQPVTRQGRTAMGPSNWENWFNTIPDSDTESEEE